MCPRAGLQNVAESAPRPADDAIASALELPQSVDLHPVGAIGAVHVSIQLSLTSASGFGSLRLVPGLSELAFAGVDDASEVPDPSVQRLDIGARRSANVGGYRTPLISEAPHIARIYAAPERRSRRFPLDRVFAAVPSRAAGESQRVPAILAG